MAITPRAKQFVLMVLRDRWKKVLDHYECRMLIHQQLLKLHASNEITLFAELLVGVSNKEASYGASGRLRFGQKILGKNPDAAQKLFRVAEEFMDLKNGHGLDVPGIIDNAHLKYFRIGIGSEASCMLNPDVCWITNTRTVWAGLVYEHGLGQANEALQANKALGDAKGHRKLLEYWPSIINEGNALSTKAGVTPPGKGKYIWADAIANALYMHHHPK
jgi:hypothetical protein